MRRRVFCAGMQRLDPQDAGAGYRNMIGVPGGMNSPLMKVIEEENVNGMKLVSGEGNKPNAKPTEDDVFNSVWIYGTFILILVPVSAIRLMTSRVFCVQTRTNFRFTRLRCTTSSTTVWGTNSRRSTRWSSRRTPCAEGSWVTRGARRCARSGSRSLSPSRGDSLLLGENKCFLKMIHERRRLSAPTARRTAR